MSYKFFFSKKISIFQTLVLCGLLSLAVFMFIKLSFEGSVSGNENAKFDTNSKLSIVNDNSYKYTKPIMYFDMDKESSDLEAIKGDIQKLIDANSQNGNLFQASIYLRDMQDGEWIILNENLKYHPGSLIKVPMMIYFLKAAEKDPSLLDKKIVYDDRYPPAPTQTYSKYSIQKNNVYTIRELLKYMVSYSDNSATMLLNSHCNVEEFKKVFSDMSLTVPDVTDTNYTISVRDFSVFLRVLYNSTYLSPQHSDFALELLSESSFNLGISNKLPTDIVIARKFGEFQIDHKSEVHESGIIYCNSRPYMLVIMTKGYNPTTLAGIISNISDSVFHFFCS